jgi:hypothetical protein
VRAIALAIAIVIVRARVQLDLEALDRHEYVINPHHFRITRKDEKNLRKKPQYTAFETRKDGGTDPARLTDRRAAASVAAADGRLFVVLCGRQSGSRV